jgi:hypothetical protein
MKWCFWCPSWSWSCTCWWWWNVAFSWSYLALSSIDLLSCACFLIVAMYGYSGNVTYLKEVVTRGSDAPKYISLHYTSQKCFHASHQTGNTKWSNSCFTSYQTGCRTWSTTCIYSALPSWAAKRLQSTKRAPSGTGKGRQCRGNAPCSRAWTSISTITRAWSASDSSFSSTPGFLSPGAYYVIHRNPRNIVVARHNSRIS